MRVFALAGAVTLATLVQGGVSRAHDHGSPPVPRQMLTSVGDGRSMAVSMLRLSASAASFVHPETTGKSYSLALDLHLCVLDWLALQARVPTHTVSPDGGRAATGVGDTAVGARFILPVGRRGQLLPGVELQFPTGDQGRGLGQGAFAVAPVLEGALSLTDRWSLLGSTLGIFNLVESASAETAFVEQRGGSELRAGVGAAYFAGSLRMSGMVFSAAPLGAAAGHFFVTAVPTVDLHLGGDLWASIFAEVPLVSDRRFDWQAGPPSSTCSAANPSMNGSSCDDRLRPGGHPGGGTGDAPRAAGRGDAEDDDAGR